LPCWSISSLSFLGLGVQSPEAEWAMITYGRAFIFDAWWYPSFLVYIHHGDDRQHPATARTP
jgi:ABC-type dipeptide/oligopeptide/nickel transport system permease subunit